MQIKRILDAIRILHWIFRRQRFTNQSDIVFFGRNNQNGFHFLSTELCSWPTLG